MGPALHSAEGGVDFTERGERPDSLGTEPADVSGVSTRFPHSFPSHSSPKSRVQVAAARVAGLQQILQRKALGGAEAALAGGTMVPLLALLVSGQPSGYGVVPALANAGSCLKGCGSTPCTVKGQGHQQYCIDVEGHTRDDAQKLVLSVSTARPVETVKLGDVQLVRGYRTANRSASAPILEVKPFQQACEASTTCGCLGCGDQCGCSVNVQCRLGGGRRCSGNECTCSHTAGVLSPGRWFIGLDAAGPFSMQAWLVSPVQLQPGERVQRGLVALEAQAATSADGSAWSDYFWLDAPPHEALTLQADLVRSGKPAGWVDVYLRFGEWPTTQLYDASMTTNPHATPASPQFVLQAERLLNPDPKP